MRILCLFFGLCALAAARYHSHKWESSEFEREPSKEWDISDISQHSSKWDSSELVAPLEWGHMLIELTENILKASDWVREGRLDEAARFAEMASKIAEKLVKMRAPIITREDAEALKSYAEDAMKAAMIDDKMIVEMAIASMEHQLEKMLETIDSMVKDVEQELGGRETMAPPTIAYILVIEDQTAVSDLEATANQTIKGDMKIPEEKKQKAIDYSVNAAKDGFKEAGTTNEKLPIFSDREEESDYERPHHRNFHLLGWGSEDDEREIEKCRKLGKFKFEKCRHHFGFRFCRRVFFRRFFHRRGYHHFFHEQE